MIIPALLVLLSALVTLTLLRRWEWDLRTASALTITLLALDFVVRPIELIVGFDSPFPDEHFASRTVDDAMARAQVAHILFLLAFFGGALMIGQLPPRIAAFEKLAGRVPASNRLLTWSLGALVLLAVVASIGPWLEHGITDLGRVAKSQRVELPRMLRTPAVLVSYLAMAVAVNEVSERRWRRAAAAGVAFLIGAAVSFSWGARGTALLTFVIPVVALLSGVVDRPNRSRRESARVLIACAMALIVVVFAGFGLRAAREVIAYGETVERTSEGTLMRRLAVTANHTGYDAALFVFDDEEPQPVSPGLGIFVDAAQLALSPLTPSTAPIERPAITVARTYEPSRANGWPITVVGDWFFAGGMPGVVIGGALSGVLLSLFDRWQAAWRSRHWVLVTTLTTIWVTSISAGGAYGVTTAGRTRTQLPMQLALIAMAIAGAAWWQRRSLARAR